MTIQRLHAREVLDSRGNPTVEVEVLLNDGSTGRAAVPSGASTGAHEAIELRDGDKNRYLGLRGVQGRGKGHGGNRKEPHRPEGRRPGANGRPVVEPDGTANKGQAGGNAILGVALAVAEGAGASARLPVFR